MSNVVDSLELSRAHQKALDELIAESWGDPGDAVVLVPVWAFRHLLLEATLSRPRMCRRTLENGFDHAIAHADYVVLR